MISWIKRLFAKPPLWKEACEFARLRPYDRESWSCGQFARLLLEEAHNRGYSCSLVITGTPENAHAWVRIEDWYIGWKGGRWPHYQRGLPTGFVTALHDPESWRRNKWLQVS